MRTETYAKIFAIQDNPKLTNDEKARRILAIFLKQKKIDKLFFKGVMRELGQHELLHLLGID